AMCVGVGVWGPCGAVRAGRVAPARPPHPSSLPQRRIPFLLSLRRIYPSTALVSKRLIRKIANERPVVPRLRQRELNHQDRDEPLLWVHPKSCSGCADPIEFSNGAGVRIVSWRDADREAKAKPLAVLKVRLE